MNARIDESDRWLAGPSVDRLLDASRSRKYVLMKQLPDPFPSPYDTACGKRWLASEVYVWMARQMAPRADPDPLANLFNTDTRESRLKSLHLLFQGRESF